ncbi:kelch repeat-containing protein [Flavobacterium sp.]|jgi:hypothetical protein|uniref:kelch repeat-containing protein n=1 Tax=Flavobacterium sp. TaxID=239 RepID=UPI0037BF7CE1
MKNAFIYLLAFTFSGFTLAQELKFSQKPKLIYDYTHKEAILFKNDSVVFKTKQKKEVSIFKSAFPGNFYEYLFINVGGRNIFVHEGCGPVLEFRNDSLVRLDKSYLHRNQFGGSLFSYKNEIYFLGGYGLFMVKKIVTKYSFENKEWDLVKTNDANIPTFTNCLSKVIDDNLYVFGGFTNEAANHKLYVLNLKTKEWKVYKSNIFKNFQTITQNQNTLLEEENGFYIIDGYKMFYLDIKNNCIKQYKNKLSKHHPGNFILKDNIYGIFEIKTDENYNFIFEKYPLKKHINNISDFIVLDQIYYEDHTELYITICVVSLLLIIILYVITRKKYWFISIVYKTPFIYCIKKEKLFYKGKFVTVLNKYDMLLLEKQFLSKNNFFPLSDLNDLFSDSKQQDTMDVLIKRRETKLNGFIKTIAAVSGLSSEKICAFKKNETDKRIKEIQILPTAITYI